MNTTELTQIDPPCDSERREPLREKLLRLWQNWKARHVARAMRTLTAEFAKDQSPGSWYDAWVANIAMPLYDRRGELDISDPEQCREFAHEQMKHFFGVKRS